MELEQLHKALYASWSRETCYPSCRKDWTEEKPNEHQCGVTALIVWYFFGGEILERRNKRYKGFFNRLPDGTIIDMSDQNCQDVDGPERVRNPKDLMKGHTKERFELLLSEMLKHLPDKD